MECIKNVNAEIAFGEGQDSQLCEQILRLDVELISDGNVCYQIILNVKSDRFRILERPNNSVHTC